MSQDAFRNFVVLSFFKKFFGHHTAGWAHGLRTPNEGINKRYLANWADVADKICFRRT